MSENTFYTPGDFLLDTLRQPTEGLSLLALPLDGHIRAGVRELVKSDRVSLRSIVAWNREGNLPFHHEEVVGEDFLYKYPVQLRCTTGDIWGKRTPILHPAVAAIDATQAGIDDAYLRAMQNVDLLVGGRREDSAGYIRTLVTRYAKITYNPVAFLTRAAALYTVLLIEGMTHQGAFEADWDRFSAVPRRITDINTFAAICNAQLREARDNIYIRVDDPSEVALVQVMLALCNPTFPVDTQLPLKQLWPQMANPGVIYSCPAALPALSTRITADDVEDAMQRFCAGLDCHDLWQNALALAQCFIARPAGAGVLGGTHKVSIAIPPSDLRIGAIGPLLAGISAEGMRSTPVEMPSRHEFLYSGVVRSVFLTAAYFEAIQSVRDAHPALLQTTRGQGPQFRHLCQASTGRSIMYSRASKTAAEAGWDCFVENMLCIYPSSHKAMAAELFRPEKVPWWTNVMGHMGKAANKFLETWAKPARPTATPTPKVWYNHTTIGSVTQLQVASAVRWLGAEVNYVTIQLPKGIASVSIPMGSVNRFLPTLPPKLALAEGGSTSAIMKFPRNVLQQLHLVEQLGKSDVLVLPMHDEDVGATVELDDLLGPMTSPFTVGESVEATAHVGQATGLDDATTSTGDVVTGKTTQPQTIIPATETPPDWEKVVLDLQGPTTSKFFKAGPLADAAAGRRTNETDMAAQSVAGINPGTLLKVTTDPTEAIRKAHSLIAATEALLPVVSGGETMQNLTIRRNAAMDALAALTKMVEPTVGWRELAAEDAASEALKEGLARSTDPIRQGAPDDPSGPEETPADFGSATSLHGSTMETRDAGGVAPHLGHLPTLGFAPPAGSSS